MLKALLLLCYLFCGHVGPFGCFFSAVWLGQVVFCAVRVKHKKHEKWGPTSEERWFWQFSLSFLLLCLMKASSSGCLNSGHVCANLRRSWCILGTYPVPCWHVSPNVGALLRLLVEVCWKWVGLWGLDQGYVEGFAAVTLLVLRPCWSTWLLFLCGLTCLKRAPTLGEMRQFGKRYAPRMQAQTCTNFDHPLEQACHPREGSREPQHRVKCANMEKDMPQECTKIAEDWHKRAPILTTHWSKLA